jgi:hypothetical protein
MCFGGGSKAPAPKVDDTQTTGSPRVTNEQTSPATAEEDSTMNAGTTIETKKKGKKSLVIPLQTGSSGVQTP